MHAPFDLTFRSEWRPAAALGEIATEWRALAASATEPNVFYDPAFLGPAIRLFAPDAGVVLVRTASGELVGLFPMQQLGLRHGYVPPLVSGLMHPFGPLGTPLVASPHPEGVIECWLDHVTRQTARAALLMPLLPEDGPFSGALSRVLARRDLACLRFGAHARALLDPGASRGDYLERSVGLKARKHLARKRRRLSEVGALTSDKANTPDAIGNLLSDFLRIESAGWKGRMGTAAAQHPAIAGFMRTALLALAAEDKVHGERLSVDGKPIAVTLMLRSGESVWAWKIAYDETFSHYSPGVQIALDVTQTMLGDPSIARVDSCATPDHPMIDHIWRERLNLSDRLISLRPGCSVGFLMAAAGYASRRAGIAAAKAVMSRLRRPSKIKTAHAADDE